MAFILTSHDLKLLRQMKLEVIANPVSGYPLSSKGGKIPLQFPIQIASDTKSADWEINYKYPFAWEPVALGASMSTRDISIEINYAVTGHTGGNSDADGYVWDAYGVANAIRNIRSYFYNNFYTSAIQTTQGAPKLLPIIRLKLLDHIADMTFRATSISETPNGSYITVGTGSYSTHTKISLSLSSITNVRLTDKGYYSFPSLVDRPPTDWY